MKLRGWLGIVVLSVGVPGSSGQELPGAVPFDGELGARLKQAWSRRGAGYKPRTRHLRADGSPEFTNRLFLESSPYLRQHAHNPVNWYPWGDEAFEVAKKLGRPVLVSVGYSTCHWCHVMEEESFEDPEIARYLNEHYVAIKVDREERPDVDSIYMAAVMALLGRGGWPMNVWLTPDRKPFYGATYVPARDGDRGISTGFLTMLRRLHEAHRDHPAKIADSRDQIVEAIGKMLAPAAGGSMPTAAPLHEAIRHYKSRFDSTNGGVKGAPKFPSSLPVRLLLRYWQRTGDKQSLEMAAKTLEKMAAGGIYDHVAGGFHRYATDERWLVPHFEKMLYDNALLVMTYLEGHQATGRADFAAVARDILRYVERDMTSPEGAFYSATDADSPNPEGKREEGWFFTWTPEELDTALGAAQAKLIAGYYGVTQQGNFEGRNILNAAKPDAGAAGQLQDARERLYQVRGKRAPPLRDEKVLTSWNALMISAHARAALTLGDPQYAARAGRAAEFLLSKLRRDGRLLRSFHEGQARHNAYLDDYAFLIAAMLDLYEATGAKRWLEEAIGLDEVLEKQYEDKENGGFYMTSHDHERLIAREKPSYDGAEPSGNSVAAMNLVRLHEFTTKDAYRARAERAFRASQKLMAAAPQQLSEMLLALNFQLDRTKEIVIVVPESRDQAEPLLAELRKAYVPNRILVVATQAEATAQAEAVPLLENKTAIRGRPTAYVCENRVCELPTSDPAVFAKQIRKSEPLPE